MDASLPPTITEIMFGTSYWANAHDMPKAAQDYDEGVISVYVDDLKSAAEALKHHSKNYQFEEISQGEYLPMSHPKWVQPILYLIKDDIFIHHQNHPDTDPKIQYYFDEDFNKKASEVLFNGYHAGKPVANRKIGYGKATEIRRTALLATYAGNIASFMCVSTFEATKRKPRFETFGIYTKIGQNYNYSLSDSIDCTTKIVRAGVITTA